MTPDDDADIPSRMYRQQQQQQQHRWMNFVQTYGLNIEFPAKVIAKKRDDDDDHDDDKAENGRSARNRSRSGRRSQTVVKTNKDLINARLLENGILFEDFQSLPQLQEGVTKVVDNLMRTNAYHSVQIQLDKSSTSSNGDDTSMSATTPTPTTIIDPQQQKQQSSANSSATINLQSSNSDGNNNDTNDDGRHPHILKVILDEKNWYSLYVGGGIKHEGMEEAMNIGGGSGGMSSRLPKAQFETSITLTNLTGYLDKSLLQYTIDQTSTSRLCMSHEKPFYSWFPESSSIGQSILSLQRGSQYTLGIKSLIDTLDYESTRSYREYIRLLQCRIDNTGGVSRPEMVPNLYWGIDWTLCLRDIVPRKDCTIPYMADASPEIVAQSGPSLLHSIKWEFRTNGCYTDHRYQPTVGVDVHATTEVAGPPGEIGYAKMHSGTAIHLPLTDRFSLHATCAGGILQPLAWGGWCPRPPTISDRFFVGGPLQLRGFVPAGIGPRSKLGGKSVPGGDAMGGNLYYTASVAASIVPPLNLLSEYGIRLFTFANAGTLVMTQQQQSSSSTSPSLSVSQIVMSTRTAAGVGISGGTPMGRVELTYAWPIRYGPKDARRNLQFGFGFSFG
jgi:hypothetical protein